MCQEVMCDSDAACCNRFMSNVSCTLCWINKWTI